MRRATLIVGLAACLCHLCLRPLCAAGPALKVDFGLSTGPVQSGYQGYFAVNAVPSSFTAQSYSVFGTTVTIRPTWVAGAVAGAMRMVDRGGGSDTPDLLRDWIGTDNRQQPGDPMTLTISGLPPGLYSWLSYHHDTGNQTGPFDVTVNDALGPATTLNIDCTSGESDGIRRIADAATFATQIVSDGSDVTLVFDAQFSTPTTLAFFLMNAFILEAQNPCYNAPPVISGPAALTVFIHRPLRMAMTVTDDGKPYIEGCDPNQPDVGIPCGLQYYWTQKSGPAPVNFDPIEANIKDPNITFTLAGTYELSLVVWDGPIGSGDESGKIAEHVVIVEAVAPVAGDIDQNEIVDFRDVRLLAAQWLDEPACIGEGYCADIDGDGVVNGRDFSLLAPNWQTGTAKIVINEFLASNGQTLLDGDGNASDWIELLNRDSRPVSLDGWHLTDDRSDLRKWPFPPTAMIPAGGYLVVFASAQATDTYVDPKGYLHTNFALNREGEYLALVGAGGAVVHQYAPVFPPQQRDISYGMWYTTERYFAIPTPGQANEAAFPGFTDRPTHSHPRGFYDNPLVLQIHCETPDAFIRYTLDGSEPAEGHGQVYDANVPITLTTTTTVRSAAFKPGWRSGGVTTHTYIFVDQVALQPADPPGWPDNWGYDSEVGGIVPADYEMDPRVVNNTLPGYSIRDALLDVPSVSISMAPDDFISSSTGIYAKPLNRWERKCSIEYLRPDGGDEFQHDCKIEIHGNSSRRPYRMQKHSMRLTFTSLYGPPKLDYPLFEASDVERFNQLVLRACFTDSWGLVSWVDSRYRPNDSQYIRDVWMKESLHDMGQPSSYGSFVHLYVNGLYFGLFNLSERLADDFFADHLGGLKEHWEINADFGTPGARWNAMMAVDPSTLEGYTQMLRYLDVEDFADYMLLHFYADAEDWPHHNGYAAANALSGDGRFRFFVWDQEIVLDYHSRAASRIGATGGVGTLFQKMRTSSEFRLLFADRVYKHLFNSGALSQAASQQRYAEIAGWIDKAIVAESARWGDTQMSTPYGSTIGQPSPLDDINHNLYPPVPNGPNYYFTREQSWVVERDNVINNYIPAIHNTANSWAILNLLRGASLYPSIDAARFLINGIEQHGGYVPAGAVLSMVNPNAGGTIYYTLDGADPRVPAAAEPPTSAVFVAESAAKRVLIPLADIGTGWTGGAEPYDDSAWTAGTGGVGYETQTGYEPYFSINVIAMRNTNQTCYIRIPFTTTAGQLAGLTWLSLNVRYDDGFAAYINGTLVCKTSTAPETLQWNSGALGSHDDSLAVLLESFDLSSWLGLLHPGDNILAIHALNYTAASTDFLLSAQLVGGTGGLAAGSISPSALPYAGPVPIEQTTVVKARVLSGAQWSPVHEAVYAAGPVAEILRITELMYHPAEPPAGSSWTAQDLEYIELTNIGGATINLNQVRFTNGVRFTFGDRLLAPGQYVLVASNPDTLVSMDVSLAAVIAGRYTGQLDNSGERLKLVDAVGATIHDFRYKDGWYAITDGAGFSLTIRDPQAAPNAWSDKSAWRPSAMVGGSPGFDDSGVVPEPGAIVINEVLAHSHAEASDWIELHNTTGQMINIGGWYLSDNDGSDTSRMKYRIPIGTILPAGGYIVFYENLHFGAASTDPGVVVPFALSENGEEVVLRSAIDGVLTGYRNYEDFGASATGVTLGRYRKSDGSFNFVAMSSPTPGAANAYPLVGPIVINEIMYNPPSGNQNEEYVELHNITSSSVTLYDYITSQPWKFTDGIELTFPSVSPVTIPAGGYLLVVKDAAAFTACYGTPPVGVQMLPYESGNLDNAGEKVEISMPGDVDGSGIRYYIRVDRVNYSDGSHPLGSDPWPAAADGAGHSLHRKGPALYGNDVANWRSAAPTPGRP